jgi:hypothetical protein
MLESLSMPHYSPGSGSDNVTDAGDQQERLKAVATLLGREGFIVFRILRDCTPSDLQRR